MFVDVNNVVEETNENDNELIGGEIEIIMDPSVYDFAFIVVAPFFRDVYQILVTNWDYENPLTNVQLNVNGNPVIITDGWGEYDFTAGLTYNFDLAINRVVYDFDLQICSNLTGNWPEFYNPTQETSIIWTQQNNPNYQDFFLEGYDENWENSEYKYEVLNNSARSFTIPANWIASTWYEYYMSIWTVNYIESGNLIAMSDKWDGMGYYRGKNGEKTDFGRMDRIKKFIENIK